ncbi:MAG: dTDP-4-dehydrorhamnose 3,5-epimerase [Porticoccaceae bacterium]
MEITATAIPDVLLIKPKVFGDSRGYFQETFQAQRYQDAGIEGNFVQDNLSLSQKGVLRGLHYQQPNPQGKLVYVLQGEVFDVAVDMRENSPTFGRWVGEYLSSENHHQLWVPPGFAHGFCVTSDTALFAYKCTEYYRPENEHCLLWNDADLDIRWPLDNPLVSAKDALGLPFKDCPLF